MRRIVLLTLFILFYITDGNAQRRGYHPGYIVMASGEYKEGWVKDRSNGFTVNLYERVRFKEDGKFRKKYRPNQLQEYGYMGLVFHSLPIREQMRAFVIRYRIDPRFRSSFLRLVEQNDELTYYHWEFQDPDSDFIDVIPLFHRKGSNEMVRVTQGIFGLKRKRLTEYFSDCRPMVQAINQKDLTHTFQVFDFYTNKCATREVEIPVN